MAARYRIFATCDVGGDALARLREREWDLEVYPEIQPPPKKLVLEKVRSGIDALVTTLRDRIDEEVLAAGAASGLKVVAQMAVGFDNIDRAAANRHRIPFTNTADVLTDATAEFAFFILGAVARKLYPAEVQVRAHQWSTWHPHKPWLGDEVTGRTLAVIGMGRIGRSLVQKAVGFDMDVLCYDPTPADDGFLTKVRRVAELRTAEGLTRRHQRIESVPLEQALREADFVSLHVPLVLPGTGGEPTFHLIDEDRLRLMKRTAYLVNTARGPVVDEQALAKALREGLDRRGGTGRVREGAPSRRQPAAGRVARPQPAPLPARGVGRAGDPALARPRGRHGRPLRAGGDRRARAPVRGRPAEDAVRGEQGSVLADALGAGAAH